MDENVKRRKGIKIVLIILMVVLIVFVVLVAISNRPQHAGKGDISILDFNSRIDYRDEMNCRIGDASDKDALRVSAKDGWREYNIENLRLGEELARVYVNNDRVYLKTNTEMSIYNLAYFNYKYSQNLPESLMLDESDERKIHCGTQDKDDYDLEHVLDYENLVNKQARTEDDKVSEGDEAD